MDSAKLFQETQSGKLKVPRKRKKDAAVEMDRVSAAQLALALGYAGYSVHNYHKKGMPRNEDGSWSVPACHRWICDQVAADIKKKFEATDDKSIKRAGLIDAQRKLAEAKYGKIMSKFLSREKVEQIAATQAEALKSYLTDGCFRNVDRFVNRSRPELIKLFQQFAEEALLQFVQSGKEMGIDNEK